MNKEEKLNEFIKLYDRFIDHYNEVKNKITATSELIIIHSELEKRMVNSRYLKINKEGKIKDFTPDGEMYYYMKSFNDLKFVESMKKVDQGSLQAVLTEIKNDYQPRKGEINEKLEILEKQQHLLEKIHLDAINSVTEKIIKNHYPESLLNFGDLGTQEKEVLRGAVLDQKNRKKERQDEHWPSIVKAVDAVVEDKPLSQFKTNNGAANSKLYNNVFKKYNGVPLGTLRDWLDEALKSGKLRQDLLEFKK